MDPWGAQIGQSSDEQPTDWANFTDNVTGKTFRDDFARQNFEKLPDSTVYLSTLERKLAKVQGKSGASTASALRRDLINGLASVRTDHMKNFMETEPVGPSSLTTIYSTDSSSNEPHFSTDSSDPLAASWLMQRVFPERQALSTEELAALIRNDALAAAVNDLSQPDNPSTHSIPAPPGCEDAASQSITTTRTTMGDHFAPAATTQHDPISSPAEESGDDGRLSDSI